MHDAVGPACSSTESDEHHHSRDEVALTQIDQRYATLRLVEPEELSRIRGSIERLGILSPVLVATAIEDTRLVLVDGFKRVRIVTDRGDVAIWVRRIAVDATAAKVAMIAANAGHRGLCDVEEAWIVRSLCRDHELTQADVGKALRRDKSWVCRRLMLAERLEEVLQEHPARAVVVDRGARARAVAARQPGADGGGDPRTG